MLYAMTAFSTKLMFYKWIPFGRLRSMGSARFRPVCRRSCNHWNALQITHATILTSTSTVLSFIPRDVDYFR
eukprot:UN02680